MGVAANPGTSGKDGGNKYGYQFTSNLNLGVGSMQYKERCVRDVRE